MIFQGFAAQQLGKLVFLNSESDLVVFDANFHGCFFRGCLIRGSIFLKGQSFELVSTR
jgi:hypothetical protein